MVTRFFSPWGGQCQETRSACAWVACAYHGCPLCRRTFVDLDCPRRRIDAEDSTTGCICGGAKSEQGVMQQQSGFEVVVAPLLFCIWVGPGVVL